MNPAQILKKGGIGVLPTDTLYGLLGSASNRATVARIYRVRKRSPTKPFIILIASHAELKKFGILPSSRTRDFLDAIWPGPVSVILDCPGKKFEHLHRGTRSLAFRLPRSRSLRRLLSKTGPLVAPTANLEGRPPAKTIAEARAYFGDTVDFYSGRGTKRGAPSTLVRVLR